MAFAITDTAGGPQERQRRPMAQQPGFKPLPSPVQGVMNTPQAGPKPIGQAPQGPAAGAMPLPLPTGQLPMPTGSPASPAGPMGGVPPVTGAAVTPLNPAQDLRFQSITPDNAGAPNLTSLAQGKFNDLIRGIGDERQQGIRAIGQGAAKFGRIGAGMTTNQLTSLEDLLQRRENEAARGLASDVAISDLGERRSQRDELRGERGYQYGLGRDSIEDRVRQKLLEEQLTQGQFGRDATRTQLGFQGNPAGIQFDAGESYGRSANDALGGVGDYLGNKELLAELARLRTPQVGTPPIIPQQPRSPLPAPPLGTPRPRPQPEI